MMRWLLALIAVSVVAGPAGAQVRPNPDRLREQIVMRFMENFRNQAGLTDDQFGQFQSVTRRSWEARREAQMRERALLRALEGQMRPGIAADQDSVAALIASLIDLQDEAVARARADQDAYAAFLNPVQRGQLMLSFTRLERQIEQVLRRRMEEQRDR